MGCGEGDVGVGDGGRGVGDFFGECYCGVVCDGDDNNGKGKGR